MAIVVKLTGDTGDLEKSLKNAGKDVEELGKKADDASGKSGKLSGALSGVSKVAGGFVLGSGLLQAPGFLLDAANAAAADEQASARLAQTIQNLGGDIEGMTAKVNERIDAGQALAFSDDEVRDSFQFLAQATNDGDEALRRQAIAMDLARGAGISLDAASKMLGKTSEENTNTLKKLGIEVAEGATEAEVLAGVQARFAGQSEAYAKSTAGQFEQAKLAMGEVVEGIGTAVLPILTKVGTVLAENLPAIQAFVGEFASKISEVLVPALQGFIEFMAPVVAQIVAYFKDEILPRVQEFMDYIQPKLVELGDWVKEQFGKFKVYYETDIKPALENIQTGVEAVIAFIAKHWPEIESVIKPVMEQVQLTVETVVAIIMGVLGILIDLIGGDFSGAWTKLQELVDTVWTSIKGSIENAIELIKNLAPIMLKAGQALGEALMDGIKKALGAVAGFAGSVADAVLSAVKNVINQYVIDPINGALRFSFDTKIPGVGSITIDAPDLPRLASGMWKVPGPNGVDQFPALLAGGEMVVPAAAAEGLRQMAAGGDGYTVTTPGLSGDGAGSDDMTDDQARFIENAMATWVKELPEQMQEALIVAFRAYGMGTISLPAMLKLLEDAAAATAPSVGPPPSIYPTAPTGPHPERGTNPGGNRPVTGPPVLGGTGGTSNPQPPPKTTPGGGLKADEDLMAVLMAMVEEQKKSNSLLSKLIDISKQPQVVDIMSRGDPKALANMLAPFLADALAQIYRRQQGVARP